MGCCGQREKLGDVKAEQKWEYINLSDFRSNSCGPVLSYIFLIVMLIVSVAVYVVDIFTAINLLVFDTWSSSVDPAIPFKVSRWIFGGCIVLSLVLLVHRWLKALRAIRSSGIAASYLDPLAVRLQSIRVGNNGRGWRRFLLFAALTKSKKGVEYIALFTYFAFEGWLRVCFAQGPRQVINAITLYSVMELNLVPTGDNKSSDGTSDFVQFFINIEALAETNKEQVLILSGMLFTLIIWVLHVISLLVGCIFYILFLWHHIPTADGSLKGYCKRKVDKSLHKIVKKKIEKTFKKEEAQRAKEEAKARRKGEKPQEVQRKPTIPVLQNTDNKLPDMPHPTRTNTEATLPPYTSRPPTRNDNPRPSFDRQPTLPNIDNKRPGGPSRSATQASAMSNRSYASNAPLVGGASDMGYADGPAPRNSEDNFSNAPTLLNRTVTGGSQFTQKSFGSQGRSTPGAPMDPLPNQDTNMSYDSMGRPAFQQDSNMSNYDSMGRRTPGPAPMPPPRQNTPMVVDAMGRRNLGPPPPSMGPLRENSPVSFGRQTPVLPPLDTQGRSTPGFFNSPAEYLDRRTPSSAGSRQMPPPGQDIEMSIQTPANPPQPSNNSGYVAFNPSMSRSATPASSQPLGNMPSPTYRNFSTPTTSRPPGDYFSSQSPPRRVGTAPLPMHQMATPPQRLGTAPPQQRGTTPPATYDDTIYDAYREYNSPPGPILPPRAATASPGGWMGPPPRGPPLRENTASPANYGPPPRINTASPATFAPPRAYTASPANFEPPSQINNANPETFVPPPRANTTTPGNYGPPPRSNTAIPATFGAPLRNNTASPAGFRSPPRSNTADPYGGSHNNGGNSQGYQAYPGPGARFNPNQPRY
ncbi:MAG: hypothetical protein M1834_002580 [Cirrosporium novae-zelandiae]|nr:MAG: hypothetical protein M1834_002580 [Cirrosporium novae-zelandiae]